MKGSKELITDKKIKEAESIPGLLMTGGGRRTGEKLGTKSKK